MTPIPVPPAVAPVPLPLKPGASDANLMEAARSLEATFLAEMLKSAGLDAAAGAFGGGIGEEQFASYLRQSQADAMVAAGGIGLAESLFNAMKARAHAKE